MNFWDAHSDRDWRDECEGPYPARVERTCSRCGKVFRMVVAGAYVTQPLCAGCWRKAQATQDRTMDRQAG